MLLPSEEDAILRAAPSFAAEWVEWESMLREASELPQIQALQQGEHRSRSLLHDLADHLGVSIAAGTVAEARAVFVVLERIYERAGEAAEVQLTMGFMEDLIDAIEREGGEASVVSRLEMGPRTAVGWQRAVEYLQRRFQ